MDTLPATVALESMTKEESADEEHDGVFPGSGADHGDLQWIPHHWSLIL